MSLKSLFFSTFFLFCIVCYGQVTDGLVGHYPLDSSSYIDKTGLSNGYISVRGNGEIYTASNRYDSNDNATRFDGGIIEAGRETRGIRTQFSVAAWVNTTQHERPIKIICNQYYCSSFAGFLLYMKEGRVALDVRDLSPSRYLTSGLSCSKVNDGYWHLVVGTLSDDGTLSIWVDGRLESITGNTPLSSLQSGCNFAIGGLASGNFKNKAEVFLGVIDEVKIYNRPLNGIEIDTLFRTPTAIQTSLGCEKFEFIVYPNPSVDTVRISTNIPGFTSYVIYDAIGRVVQSDIFQEHINVSHFASGCYFLRARNPLNGDRTVKLEVFK